MLVSTLGSFKAKVHVVSFALQMVYLGAITLLDRESAMALLIILYFIIYEW